jgi:hypothetical protein
MAAEVLGVDTGFEESSRDVVGQPCFVECSAGAGEKGSASGFRVLGVERSKGGDWAASVVCCCKGNGVSSSELVGLGSGKEKEGSSFGEADRSSGN